MTHYCPHCDRALVEDYEHGKICYMCTDCSYYIYKQDITDNIIYHTNHVLKLKTVYVNPKHDLLDTLIWKTRHFGQNYQGWIYTVARYTQSLKNEKNSYNQPIDTETQQLYQTYIAEQQRYAWSYFL